MIISDIDHLASANLQRKILDAGDNLTIVLDSPGGSMFDAIVMHRMLRASSTHITVNVIMAAGAALALLPAADKVVACPGAELRFMNSFTVTVVGAGSEVIDAQRVCAETDAEFAKILAELPGLSEDEAYGLMRDEAIIAAEDAERRGWLKVNPA